MQVIVHSDHNITADASLTQRVEAEVSNSIGRFAERIVKVEAFLSDTNSSKHGAREKRCVLEAKVAGSGPVVASDEAPTVLQALEGAAGKLERALEHAFGKHAAATGKSPREKDLANVDELTELEKWQRERNRK